MSRVIVIAIILAIVIANVFMWRSDMPTDMKVTFTTINAIAWTIVLAPIFLVDRWLDAVRQRKRDDDDAKSTHRGQQSEGRK